jgi:hypothetical protein
VVTNAWKILNTAASDEDDGVFLQVMAFTRNVSRNFDSVGQAYTGYFTKSRVWLLWSFSGYLNTHTSFKGCWLLVVFSLEIINHTLKMWST